MAAGSKYCSTCRSTYRGLFAVHASTAKHRRNLHRGETSRHGRKARARPAWMVAIRRDYGGEDKVHVVRHRRSPPRDGKRRIVPVASYWRNEPYMPQGRLYRPTPHGRRRRK